MKLSLMLLICMGAGGRRQFSLLHMRQKTVGSPLEKPILCAALTGSRDSAWDAALDSKTDVGPACSPFPLHSTGFRNNQDCTNSMNDLCFHVFCPLNVIKQL